MPLKRVAIFGGGNMGSAIAKAFTAPGSGYAAADVVIAEPDLTKHPSLRALGYEVVPNAKEAVRNLSPDGIAVLAVKPQLFAALCSEIGKPGPRLIISIMAGITSERVHKDLGGRVVRAMPNLPMVLGRGMTAVSGGPGSTREDVDATLRLFALLGKCLEIPESLFDAVTAVASSGPAYVFYLAESMIRGAIAVGFSPEAAQQLVRQTVVGAAAMLDHDHDPPEVLRQRITSKGGTTQAATSTLDARGMPEAIIDAIKAAAARGRELSQM